MLVNNHRLLSLHAASVHLPDAPGVAARSRLPPKVLNCLSASAHCISSPQCSASSSLHPKTSSAHKCFSVQAGMALPGALRLLRSEPGVRPSFLELQDGVTQLGDLSELLVETSAQEVVITWLGSEEDAPALQQKGSATQEALRSGIVLTGTLCVADRAQLKISACRRERDPCYRRQGFPACRWRAQADQLPAAGQGAHTHAVQRHTVRGWATAASTVSARLSTPPWCRTQAGCGAGISPAPYGLLQGEGGTQVRLACCRRAGTLSPP